jgi:hypothetical protein
MRYVIAVKREARSKMTEKLSDLLNRVRGLKTVGGDESLGRYQVEATPEAVDELNRLSADRLHVEPLIEHERLPSNL